MLASLQSALRDHEGAAIIPKLDPLSLIAAYARGRVIGSNLDLPWHHPEDLRFFKEKTLGHPVIMGRRSFEALGCKPLPKRPNYVITRNRSLAYEGVEVFNSLESALEHSRSNGTQPPFVIGGGEVYAQALPYVTTMYLTEIDEEHPGDAYFPEFDLAQWRVAERRTSGPLTFLTLERQQYPSA